MAFLSALALILLTLVGFSSGAALAAGEREIPPTIWDLLLVLALWVLAFLLRDLLGKWGAIVVFLVAGLLLGYLVTTIRGRNKATPIPVSELPEHARQQTAVSRNPLRRAWQAWTRFAQGMGNVQGRLLMGFFYFIVVTPFGAATHLFSDPLGVKKTPAASGWESKQPLDSSLDTAREQG